MITRLSLMLLLLISPCVFAMKGVFWQPQLRDNAASDASWQALMTDLRQQGIDTLVLQWTRYGDVLSTEQQQAILMRRAEAARQAGLKLIIGLNLDPDFFHRQKQPAAALENFLRRLRVTDLQQARRWADLRPDGWYISAEIDDLNWRDDDRRALMLRWLGDTHRLLGSVVKAPVYISSFFAGHMSPEGYGRMVMQMQQTGVKVWVQDGSGVDKLTLVQRDRYLDDSAGCASSGRASGIIYELFAAGKTQPFSARPKTAAEVASLLARRSECGNDTLYFSLRYLPAANGVLEWKVQH